MAKIALAAAGGLFGALLSPFLGPGAIFEGISIGLAVGGLLFRPTPTPPPLQDLQVSGSADGAPIPFGYGLQRFGGQIIWTPGITYSFEEQSSSAASYTTLFSSSFAAAFCEGPANILRVWGDTKLIYDSDPMAATDYPVDDYPAWVSTQLYNPGNQVAYSGQVYQCLETNTGVEPDTSGTTDWLLLSDTPAWIDTQPYNPGDVVNHDAELWVCLASNTDVSPGSNSTDWQSLASYYPAPTLYPGNNTQLPDPDIQASEGASVTPAFRGLCYMTMIDFPLANFGNRIPNIRAEIQFLKVAPTLGG